MQTFTIPVGSGRPGWVGWLEKLEIRLNSAQLELELGKIVIVRLVWCGLQLVGLRGWVLAIRTTLNQGEEAEG